VLNLVQFAVVREDPECELRVVRSVGARRALLIGSGGCTAFALRSRHPEIELVLVEPNPAQRELMGRKIEALGTLRGRALFDAFDVGERALDAQLGWTQCGNFEALFRSLRRFLNEFVAAPSEIRDYFESPRAEVATAWFASRYWKAAFAMHFCDALLEAMFTKAATQHALPGSYPAYFQAAFERGLLRADAKDNYFLHHVLLGHYRARALPTYLTTPPELRGIEFRSCRIEEVEDFSEFDLIHLSNVMDWMEDDAIETLFGRLRRTTRSGATVVWRQLNNNAALHSRLGHEFHFESALESELLEKDRSLFYCRIGIARRIA